MSLFVSKLSNIVKDNFSVFAQKGKTKGALSNIQNTTKAIDLNVSPANINRPKLNNLSSRFLIQNKGRAFVPKDCDFEMISSVHRGSAIKHRFLDEKMCFKPEYKASELPILNKKLENVFVVDNLHYPNGSVAITKGFDDVISTSGLWQCAGLAIVDKKEKTQTLLHFCPTVLKKYNDELLDYLLKFGDPENLEFTIVPGCFDDTDNTMAVLFDKIKEKIPKANINFKFFPENSDEVLVLKNGNLFSTEYSNILSKVVNPMEDICYATIPNDLF